MHDLGLTEELLAGAYKYSREDAETATERAAARIADALLYMRTFELHPHRGTEHPEMLSGIRTVTSGNFIFYFEIDDAAPEVRILAVFFGGIDRRRQIVERLRSPRRG